MRSQVVSAVVNGVVGCTLLANAAAALAHHPYDHRYYHQHEYRHGDNWSWVAPALIVGALAYGLTRPTETVVVQQPVHPVYIQPPPVVNYAPVVRPFTPMATSPEVVYIDGATYIKQIMMINGVSQSVLIRR
jgi:hypothetical protein